MQLKCFLFESLLLAAVNAGPLRKDSQFHYQRQDATPQKNSSTSALVQSQTSSTVLSDIVAAYSVVTATGAGRAPTASLLNQHQSTSTADPEVLTVIPIARKSTAHMPPTIMIIHFRKCSESFRRFFHFSPQNPQLSTLQF